MNKKKLRAVPKASREQPAPKPPSSARQTPVPQVSLTLQLTLDEAALLLTAITNDAIIRLTIEKNVPQVAGLDEREAAMVAMKSRLKRMFDEGVQKTRALQEASEKRQDAPALEESPQEAPEHSMPHVAEVDSD
jgi:hypothetical protein